LDDTIKYMLICISFLPGLKTDSYLNRLASGFNNKIADLSGCTPIHPPWFLTILQLLMC